MLSTNEPLAGQSILVVEDTYWIAADVRRTLKRAGAAVVGPVSHIQRALDAIRSETIDVAVLDVNLDGMLSYPVASELDRRSIPYVFATGYESWALPKKWRSVTRIEKPIGSRALVEAIKRLLPARAAPAEGDLQ